MASTACLGRHAPSWDEPHIFRPERFLGRGAGNGIPRAYLAFGAGPRSCVGQQLALTLASLALAHMVADADAEGAL